MKSACLVAFASTLVVAGLLVYPPPDAAFGASDTIVVTFLNDTGQTVNDLHVEFNVPMNPSIVAWQGQGVAFPTSEPDGNAVHLEGADVQDGNGTKRSFTADVPGGGSLTIVSAHWTLDGDIVGPAEFTVD